MKKQLGEKHEALRKYFNFNKSNERTFYKVGYHKVSHDSLSTEYQKVVCIERKITKKPAESFKIPEKNC